MLGGKNDGIGFQPVVSLEACSTGQGQPAHAHGFGYHVASMEAVATDASPPDDSPARAARMRLSAGRFGSILFLLIALPCFLSLPWTLTAPRHADSGQRYNDIRLHEDTVKQSPGMVAYPREVMDGQENITTIDTRSFEPMGTDSQGRSLFVRCLLGGAISLGIGVAAALMAVFIGVTWGALSGYIGGRTDAFMMRIVDILYGLPYLLLVVMISVAVSGLTDRMNSYLSAKKEKDPSYGNVFLEFIQSNPLLINLLTLVVAIGGISWLTMARVIRGQVLSLRTQPFIEAARAQGMGPARILRVHLLPNLIGPIVVYTTLAVPQAILQESFLSFLSIGVQEPMPSWGGLAAVGVKELPSIAMPELAFNWWLLVFPCVLLGLTLMSLNFMGDALRERFDPRSEKH